MKALVLGGTGVIGAGIVKHLLARGASVTVVARGNRQCALPEGVTRCAGDRADPSAILASLPSTTFDVVVDLVCFQPAEAEAAVRAFAGKCEHLLFCSTVCTYGVKIPPAVLVDESFPQEPTTAYGRAKVECERVFLRAAESRAFAVTVVRPSQTYGPGGPMLDQIEVHGVGWDRVERGLPLLSAGDGLGLWQSTHRDDVGKFFAHAALNEKTYGEAYNVTRSTALTWRDYHREVASALGKDAQLIFAPAAWLASELGSRAAFLAEISGFHGAYDSSKAKAHVPAFDAAIGLAEGASETLADIRRRGAWRETDAEYQRVVDKALALGFPLVTA